MTNIALVRNEESAHVFPQSDFTSAASSKPAMDAFISAGFSLPSLSIKGELKADLFARSPMPFPMPGNDPRFPHPHRRFYPYWYGDVRRDETGSRQFYHFNGPLPQVDSISDMLRHKEALDWSRRDLLDTRPIHKNDPAYRDEVRDVVLAHFYLLYRVYQWGSNHPNRDVLNSPRYHSLVRDTWQDAMVAVRDFERHNGGDSTLRQTQVTHLYRALKDTWLDNREWFYRDLVEDIGRAIN